MNGTEGFMLSDRESQTKTNIIWSPLYVEPLKKKRHVDIENRSMATRSSSRGGKMVKAEKGTKSLL